MVKFILSTVQKFKSFFIILTQHVLFGVGTDFQVKIFGKDLVQFELRR